MSDVERAEKSTASTAWEMHPRFPFVMDHAHGPYVWGTDGRRFVDFTSCSGAAPLGAGHEYVVEKTVEALRRTGGIVPGPVSALRVEVAERLRDMFPIAERALFFRTGSCATTAAVRLARVATGRRRVLTSGFHGWHDWHLQYRPHLAFPDRDPDTADFGYDHATAAGLLGSGDVAAVIVTPEVNFFPHDHLRELGEMTGAAGALLIVDEVMTGFRYRRGGYSAAAGVTPDLMTLSKGLANGTALSAVVGSERVMRAHESTYLGNTYQRETTPFAAALATFDVYEVQHPGAPRPLDAIAAIGRTTLDGLNDLFEETGVGAWALSEPSMFDMVFADAGLGHAFCTEMWKEGYLMQYGGRFMPSASLSAEDVRAMLGAARTVLGRIELGAGTRGAAPPARALIDFAAENFAATPAAVHRWSVAGVDD